MAAAPRTLDIRELQILRHYPADGAGFFWHHRVLLEKTGPGIWIGVSPDGDIKRIDLNMVAHIPLDRRADFPAPQAPFVYAFDPIPRADLEGYHRRARVMANLFNDAGGADVEAFEWVIADTSRLIAEELSGKTTLITGLFLGMPPWLRLMEKKCTASGFLRPQRSQRQHGFCQKRLPRETCDCLGTSGMARVNASWHFGVRSPRCAIPSWRIGHCMDRGPLSSICMPLGTDAEACGPLPQRLYSSRIRCLFPSSLAASAVREGKIPHT